MPRGVHKGLTPARILEESFAIVDADGPSALTMRGLARRLNVAAMAIYNHFADRDAIVDALANQVFAELSAQPNLKRPQAQAPWMTRLRSILKAAHQLASKHPHVYRLAMSRPNKPSAAAVLTSEAMNALREAGLNEDQAATVYNTFVMVLHGFPFWREAFERHLADCVPPGKLRRPIKPALLAERQFEASVNWLLKSVESLGRTS